MEADNREMEIKKQGEERDVGTVRQCSHPSVRGKSMAKRGFLSDLVNQLLTSHLATGCSVCVEFGDGRDRN